MTFKTVKTDREGYVGLVTLDRPASMNTFSTQLAVDLDDALWELEDDEDVRAVVVDGAGRAFSAGIDVSEHGDYETEAEYEEWVSKMEVPFVTLRNMETPVIAAAHGHAAANGVGLVAACDLAVAAEGTQLGATAPKVGLFCMGPAVPLRRTLPDKRTLELILTGKLIDAETALDWGLVNEVVPEDELQEAATDLANEIASKSPMAIRMGKTAYDEMADMDYEEALAYSNGRFAELCATADAEAGIAAFLDGDPLDADEWPGK
ncbi:MAG: enoyl-CoA hydratase/carnithine racemase [Natrialbaceae archaeon]|jgi:enoyl-CoA hydratase/carnithine racemase